MLYCVDDSNELVIAGQSDMTDVMRLEVNLIPCQSTESQICNKTYEEAIDYIGDPELIVVHNHERFDTTRYDTGKIVKESIIKNWQFSS